MKKTPLLTLAFLLAFIIANTLTANAQVQKYNLQELLKKGMIITVPEHETRVLENTKNGAITTKGIVWIKGIDFKDGTVDIDLRGKNVFLKSFLGIAFRATDTITCDLLLFRPFNFKHPDTARNYWSVAYNHMPYYDFARLRKEHPHVYENKATPVPEMDDWFHATFVIKGMQASVYVNHSTVPSLTITLLSNRQDGLFGLYSDGLTNDFANLEIKYDK